jgi:hypothetical protein
MNELDSSAGRSLATVSGSDCIRGNWSAAEPDSIEALQIIYKVAERCNINCTYCHSCPDV